MSPRHRVAGQVISQTAGRVGVAWLCALALIRGFLQRPGQVHRRRSVGAMPPRTATRNRHADRALRKRRISVGVVIGVVQIMLMLMTLIVMLRAPGTPYM